MGDKLTYKPTLEDFVPGKQQTARTARVLAQLLMACGLALGSLSAFGALPPFRIGIWTDSEAIVVAVLFSATLCAAGSGVWLLADASAVKLALHPSVILFFALGIWSIAVAGTVEYPALSVLGPPQTGQGALWYFAMAVFVSSALAMRPFWKIYLSLVAFVAICATAVSLLSLGNTPWLAEWFVANGQTPPQFLLMFNEYQAFYAIALIALAITTRSRSKTLAAAAGFAALFVLLLSRNRAAMISVGIAATALAIVYRSCICSRVSAALLIWRSRGQTAAKKTLNIIGSNPVYIGLFSAVFTAAAIHGNEFGAAFVLAAAGVAGVLLSRKAEFAFAASTNALPSQPPANSPKLSAPKSLSGPWPARSVYIVLIAVQLIPAAVLLLFSFPSIPTLHSRHVLLQALLPSLTDPYRLLTGHGWGSYGEYLARNLTNSKLHLLNSAWIDLSRDEFHSHSAAIEALFSAGLPGLLLTLALPVSIFGAAQKRWRFVAAAFAFCWALTAAVWFEMPATLTALALAIAAVTKRMPGVPFRFFNPRSALWPSVLIAAVLSILFASAAVRLRDEATAMQRLAACATPVPVHEDCADVGILHEWRENSPALAAITAGLQPHILKLKDDEEILARRILDDGVRRPYSTMLSLALLNDYATLGLSRSPAPTSAQKIDFVPDWIAVTLRTLEHAPARLDILPVLLNWLLVHHHDDDFARVLNRAHDIAPDHPVVEWYEGVRLLGSREVGKHARGLSLLRGALKHGVERYMPVSARIKADLSWDGR